MYLQKFFLFMLVTTISGNELTVNPSLSRQVVRENDKHTITCSTSLEGGEVKWVTPDGSTTSQKASPDSGDTVTLEFKSFNFDTDPGKYTCQLTVNGRERNNFEVNIVGVKVNSESKNFTFEKIKEPITLKCKPTFSTTDTVTGPVWYQGDKKISELKDVRFKEDPGNLTLNSPLRTDAGMYSALYTVTSQDQSVYNYSCPVELLADPFVLSFEKSKNLIDEDKLELQCKVLGYPNSVITWYKDDVKVTNATFKALDGNENAQMIIEKVNFADAGVYKCTATSSSGISDSKEITVRVKELAKTEIKIIRQFRKSSKKDKLAALWPFLGIVGEVIILCLIIFCFEKKRAKETAQAEAGEPEDNGQMSNRGNARNRKNNKN